MWEFLLLDSQVFLNNIPACKAQRKAHIPEAHTQTIIFPVLSSGSGGRKGRGGKKGEVAGVVEARIPISAKQRVVLLCGLVRAAFSESLKDGETHRRLSRPEWAAGEENPARPTGNVFYFFFGFFSIAPVRTKRIATNTAMCVTRSHLSNESLVINMRNFMLNKKNDYQ